MAPSAPATAPSAARVAARLLVVAGRLRDIQTGQVPPREAQEEAGRLREILGAIVEDVKAAAPGPAPRPVPPDGPRGSLVLKRNRGQRVLLDLPREGGEPLRVVVEVVEVSQGGGNWARLYFEAPTEVVIAREELGAPHRRAPRS